MGRNLISSIDRRRRANSVFIPPCAPPDSILSDEIYEQLKTEANIGKFNTTRDGLIAWVFTQPHDVRNEILFRGCFAILAKCRGRTYRSKHLLVASHSESASRGALARTKAKSFDRIIAVLDTMYVGNNLLGDCKKPDLLRASVEAHRVAGEWDVKATLYKELAALLPDNTTTVRKAAGRDKIVALLTTTFRE